MDRYNNPLYNWVSPAPYMYRNGWDSVYQNGVTPQSLGDVARQYYINGLNNLQQWGMMNGNQGVSNLAQMLLNRQVDSNIRQNPIYKYQAGPQ